MNCHLFIPSTQDEKAAGKKKPHNVAAELHKEVTKGHETQFLCNCFLTQHFTPAVSTWQVLNHTRSFDQLMSALMCSLHLRVSKPSTFRV